MRIWFFSSFDKARDRPIRMTMSTSDPWRLILKLESKFITAEINLNHRIWLQVSCNLPRHAWSEDHDIGSGVNFLDPFSDGAYKVHLLIQGTLTFAEFLIFPQEDSIQFWRHDWVRYIWTWPKKWLNGNGKTRSSYLESKLPTQITVRWILRQSTFRIV